VRVFAALPLPQAASAALAAAVEPLRSAFPGIRWVNASGFHITLHFFGELETRQVDELRGALGLPGLHGPSIAARLGALGQFPPQGRPRVLWVSLERGADEARSCWERFERTVAPLGWQPDPRGFTPHITAGRAGREPPPFVDTAAFSAPALDFKFSEIVLFESVPGRGGAVYNPLERAALDGRSA
jgi:2'-5' RNA ligase